MTAQKSRIYSWKLCVLREKRSYLSSLFFLSLREMGLLREQQSTSFTLKRILRTSTFSAVSRNLKLSGTVIATTIVETQYPAALRQNPHYPFERATYFRLSESLLQISFLVSRERNIGEPLNQSCRQFLDRYSRIRRFR